MRIKSGGKLLGGIQRKVGIVLFTALAVFIGLKFKDQIKTAVSGLASKVDSSLGTKVDNILS